MQTNKQSLNFLRKFKKGFTLIEMLVVIGIIGVLSTMIIVSVSSVRKNSVCTRREANIENVRGAISMYYSIKNKMPDYSGGWYGAACDNDPATEESLICALSEKGYLSENIEKDDNDDETAEYGVRACGGGDGNCSMVLWNTCEVTGREGYVGNLHEIKVN